MTTATGHRLLQILPARGWWVGTCICGWTSQLCDTRDRAAYLVETHCLENVLPDPERPTDPTEASNRALAKTDEFRAKQAEQGIG